MSPLPILVFASGRGSNFQAILDAIATKKLNVEVLSLITNHKGSGAEARAIDAGIVAEYCPFPAAPRDHPTRQEAEARLIGLVKKYEPELIVLAGWDRILGAHAIDALPPTINLHPALPGGCVGMNCLEKSFRALKKGNIRQAGAMIHLVTTQLDRGPVLAMGALPAKEVLQLEPFSNEIHQLEHRLLCELLSHLATRPRPLQLHGARNRIEGRLRAEISDPRRSNILQAIHDLGLTNVSAIEIKDLLWVESTSLLASEVAEVAFDPLATEIVTRPSESSIATKHPSGFVEIAPRSGVTDPAVAVLIEALGAEEDPSLKIRFGTRVEVDGLNTASELDQIATALLANPVIHRFTINKEIDPGFGGPPQAPPPPRSIAISSLDDSALSSLSRRRRLALNLAEMRRVQSHFIALHREPTDVELETLAQTWSEHCVHKTFKAHIIANWVDADGVSTKEEIDGLLPSLIEESTRSIGKKWVRSAFEDNAGIIELTEMLWLAFKVETHNHPSALEPFGGANTGIGGVIRDILGVSARPIANTNILCFGEVFADHPKRPKGTLHPRRIGRGVIAGIGDYGNKLGIPTVNGALCFDPGYNANPLVFCGCAGVLPANAHPRRATKGDRVILVGGLTGRDGLGGATFSSMEMDSTTHQIAGSAVQVGHPVQEKSLLDLLMLARDASLYHAVNDCGAGGLSSAIGEMADGLGALIDLDRVPLKYEGLAAWEIWLSESQERMVLAVPPTHLNQIYRLAHQYGVPIADLGVLRSGNNLTIKHRGEIVASLDLDFVHRGLPKRQLYATWHHPPTSPLLLKPSFSIAEALLDALSDPDLSSKEEIIRRYDFEVQGGTWGRAFAGAAQLPCADGAVVVPIELQKEDGPTGVAFGCGINPSLGKEHPYEMGWAVVDEAIRNVVALGAAPSHLALLDNFCWGDPNDSMVLGSLTLATKGACDAAKHYQTPFISGKDSLNNSFRGASGQLEHIPGTLLISSIAKLPDATKRCSSAPSAPGELLFLIGETDQHLSGGLLEKRGHLSGGKPPQPARFANQIFETLHQAIGAGELAACHDCSEGGLAVTLAEMLIAANLGAEISLPTSTEIEPIVCLFSESLSRFVVSLCPTKLDAFKERFRGLPTSALGRMSSTRTLVVKCAQKTLLSLPLNTLAEAWRGQEWLTRGAL